MSCPTCLVGFAGLGAAPQRSFAPTRADVVRQLGATPTGSDQLRVLAAFGVGALLGYVVLRAALPMVEGRT